MPEREIKTTLELDGAEKFNRNLQSVDSELKVLSKELGVLTSKYNENSKTAASLAAQQKNLKDQVSLNEGKVKGLKDAIATQTSEYTKQKAKLEELIKEQGAESDEVIKQAKELRHTEIELDSYRKKLADSERALMKSSAALNKFNEENGKTKIGQSFTAGKAAVDDFREKISSVTSKIAPLTNAIKGVGKEAAKITFKAGELSAKAFAATVENGMKASLSAVTSYTKALAAAATTTVTTAVAAVSSLTNAAVENYGDYEQLAGGVETLFKNNADTVKKYANNAYATAGMSASEYMETVTGFSASLLQSMGNDTKAAANKADLAITDMADNVNKFGNSMENVSNTYKGLAKGNFSMLDNLSLGYGGNKSEMERLLSDAEKLSGIHYDISSYADMIDAIHVIQEEMGIAGATKDEAEKTIQGSTAAMKSAYKNLMTGIADEDADMDMLIKNLVDSVEKAGNNIIPRIDIALNGISKAIDVGIPIILDKIPPMVIKLAPKLGKTVGELISKIASHTNKALPQFTQTVLPKAVDQIQKALPSLLANLTSGFNKLLLSVADAVIIAMPVVTQTVLPSMIQGTTDLVKGLVHKLPEFLSELTSGAVNLFMGLIDGLDQVMDELLPLLPSIVSDMTSQLFASIPEFLGGAMELFGKLLEALELAVQEIMPQLPQLITDMCTTFRDNIGNIIDTGFDLLISLIDGFTAAMPTIMSELPKIVVDIATKLTDKDNLGRLLKAGTDLIREVAKGFPKAVRYIGENLPTIINNIIDSLMEVDWLGLGIDIVKGILEGFLNVGDIIWDYVSSFKDELLDDIGSIFEIFSPSHVMRDDVGKYLGLGVVDGFISAMKKGTDDMAASIPREFDTDIKLNTAADLSYMRGLSSQAARNITYNIPVNVTFTGKIDSSTDYRRLAEGIAQETQFQLAGLGLTG